MDSTRPVPKPRARYQRDQSRVLNGENLHQAPPPARTDEEGPPPLPPSASFPSLASVTSIISGSIPSLAGVATSISAPAPMPPHSPDALGAITSSMATHIPSLAGEASAVANSASTPNPAAANMPSLDDIMNSLTACIPGFTSPASAPPLSGSDVPCDLLAPREEALASANAADARPAVTMTTSMTPSPGKKQRPPSLTRPETTDIEALSRLVMETVSDNRSGPSCFPPPEEDFSPSPTAVKGERPYTTVLPNWDSQDDPESESSNEEEGPGGGPAHSGADEPMGGNVSKNPAVPNHDSTQSDSSGPSPCRSAPLPPVPSQQPIRKQKTPRAATIRVSRNKRNAAGWSLRQNTGWLDVWKGFRHNVLWATLDGKLMSLWKKRTDKFSEVLFHVSSITNIKKQDKGRFSVYFKKKHYDFMAQNDAIQEVWITSLLASRGQPSPTPQYHGPITIKDPRKRVYAAVLGHDLWVYHNNQDFQVGVAWFMIPLIVAAVKQGGKRNLNLITPYRGFSLVADSAADLASWHAVLLTSIRSALACSQVALQLCVNPFNKVCGDCGAAGPEWASVNLLLLLCDACAGQHRSLGNTLSKVRSLKMDSKVWTEPLIKLFVQHGNRAANQIWSPLVPAAEQLVPDSSDDERSEFIRSKYSRGRYRRPHPLASSPALIYQRLCQVVCGDDVEETLALICSGAKVTRPSDPDNPSAILVAERAGQVLQTELLRHNKYTEILPSVPQSANRGKDSSPSEEEELHGKLEEDRFLFSLENDSAACDVLDLREVRSVLRTQPLQFVVLSLSERLLCAAETQEVLRTHMSHILQVILQGGVSETEAGGVLAASRLSVTGAGGASEHCDVWCVLQAGGVTVHTAHALPHTLQELHTHTLCDIDPVENTINVQTGDRSVCLRFEDEYSCESWFKLMKEAAANQSTAPPAANQSAAPPAANQSTAPPAASQSTAPPASSQSTAPPAANQSALRPSLYQKLKIPGGGRVPAAIERCVSHITQHGLRVEGVYRRCGLASKVSRLVEALGRCPGSAPLEADEQGVIDAGSALKQYVRQQPPLLMQQHEELWVTAAAEPDEQARLVSYRQLLQKLPDDNRATLSALFGHFYIVQLHSSQNQMSPHNLAVVLVPTFFQKFPLSADFLRLTREFIIHHTLLFLSPGAEEGDEDVEQITVF